MRPPPDLPTNTRLKVYQLTSKIEWAQVIHYLRASRIPYALLINLGRSEIQYETFDLANLPSI